MYFYMEILFLIKVTLKIWIILNRLTVKIKFPIEEVSERSFGSNHIKDIANKFAYMFSNNVKRIITNCYSLLDKTMYLHNSLK